MEPEALRDDMVDGLEHEAKGVVADDRIADALRTVPRHEFVDEDPDRAYVDRPFEHRDSRVLSPSTAARLLEALAPEPDQETLVVGAGVGYTVAVLAEIVGPRRVHAVDISRDLVLDARSNLARTGYGDVLVDCRDGAAGLSDYAPYDRILVEAAAVEPPAALLEQLADGGRLVMARRQSLVAADRSGVVETFGPIQLAPLLVDGEQGGAIERNRAVREERERATREAASSTGWEHDWIDWERR